MAFETHEAGLAWTWTVKRMEDGSPYLKRVVKDTCLVRLSPFSRTSSLLEVQGTWSFPKDAKGTVTLRAYVEQTLRYDAALERPLSRGGGFQLETCVSSPGESRAKLIQISLEVPEHSAVSHSAKCVYPLGRTEGSKQEDTPGLVDQRIAGENLKWFPDGSGPDSCRKNS